MEDRLRKLGINEFGNTRYIYKPKDVRILDNEINSGVLIQIETSVLKNGFHNLSIHMKFDEEWLTAFDCCYKDGVLCEDTRVDELIPKYHYQTIELSFEDSDFSSGICYHYTSDYDDSLAVLDELINLIVPLELDKREDVEKEEESHDEVVPDFAPLEAMAVLRDHLIETVKDLSSYDDLLKETVRFLEGKSGKFRAYVSIDDQRDIPNYDEFWKKDINSRFVDDLCGILPEYFGDDSGFDIEEYNSLHLIYPDD